MTLICCEEIFHASEADVHKQGHCHSGSKSQNRCLRVQPCAWTDPGNARSSCPPLLLLTSSMCAAKICSDLIRYLMRKKGLQRFHAPTEANEYTIQCLEREARRRRSSLAGGGKFRRRSKVSASIRAAWLMNLFIPCHAADGGELVEEYDLKTGELLGESTPCS